jgi:TonB family protein
MKTAKLVAYSPYGAFELKRCYQKNMFLGTIISCLTALVVIVAFTLAAYIAGLNSAAQDGSGSDKGTRIILYPDDYKPPLRPGGGRPPKDIGIKNDFVLDGALPNPVDDYEVLEVKVLASKNDRIGNKPGNYDTEFGLGTGKGIDTIDLFGHFADPKPTDFVPRTENPVLLDAPVPAYPEIARKARIEAAVWIMVLVDTEGNVKDALISKSSDLDLGFDEAALAAAWGRKYRPAMQNDQPVAVWIHYKVKFEIEN